MYSAGRSRTYLLVALCFLTGVAGGYTTRRDVPAEHRPDAPALAVTEATPDQIAAEVRLPVDANAPANERSPAASAPHFPPLPPLGPIRELLPELHERARRGDQAAARRAHRDLQYCAEARVSLQHVGDAHKAQASCVAERLCTGLRLIDLAEAGAFLMRAAELGDPDAMAAVADSQAVDATPAGIRRMPATRALAPAYMRQALQAGSPIAMYKVVVGICMQTDPVMAIPFHRDFPPEERLAWFHAIRPLLQRPQLRDFHLHCSERWTPDAAARAEARGRALHAQFYATRRDLPESAEAGWRQALTELGRFEPQGEDPRWADFPECAG